MSTLSQIIPKLFTQSATSNRYRGFNVGDLLKGEDGKDLEGEELKELVRARLDALDGDWKVNVLRWQLVTHNRTGIDEYFEWLEVARARLDYFLTMCDSYVRKNGRSIRVIVDLHRVPGGFDDKTEIHAVLKDSRGYNKWSGNYIQTLEKVVNTCKRHPCVLGYDIFNEPKGSSDLWVQLAERAVKAVRARDRDRVIVIENEGLDPRGMRQMIPLRDKLSSDKNIWYSVHVYDPIKFTHQGLPGHPDKYTVRYTEKDSFDSRLKVAKQEFSDRGFPVYVGEFSVSSFAPQGDAERYLTDAVNTFESYGWHWTYHAYGDDGVWSAEQGARAPILKSKFARNR